MDDELKEILSEFLVEAEEMIELLDQRFISLEADPTNRAMLDEIFRAMHSMKGSGGFLGILIEGYSSRVECRSNGRRN